MTKDTVSQTVEWKELEQIYPGFTDLFRRTFGETTRHDYVLPFVLKILSTTLSTLVKEMEGLKVEVRADDYERKDTAFHQKMSHNAGISAAIKVINKL